MLSDISVDTNEAKLFYENHKNISHTITNQRLSISGVDEDDEALDLVKFQNAYNASSRFMTVISDMIEHIVTRLGNG